VAELGAIFMAELIAHNIDELGDFWARLVYPFVRPIVEADQKGRAIPIGSGVLVSYRDNDYLLTANHVTKDACLDNQGGVLYTFVPEQVEIHGVNNYVPDPFDLSMTELPPPSRRCLKLPQHLASDIRPGERCLVLGFPARSKSWEIDHSRRTLQPKPLPYLGAVYRSSPEQFSVRFSPKRTYRNGKKLQRRGKLNGISGGGAFVLREDQPRLAGIVIEYHSNRGEMICTNSAVIWSMVSRLETDRVT
jgi:hypothetical protein